MENKYGKLPKTQDKDGLMGVVTLKNPIRCIMQSNEDYVITDSVYFTHIVKSKDKDRIFQDYLGIWIEINPENILSISYVKGINELSIF